MLKASGNVCLLRGQPQDSPSGSGSTCWYPPRAILTSPKARRPQGCTSRAVLPTSCPSRHAPAVLQLCTSHWCHRTPHATHRSSVRPPQLVSHCSTDSQPRYVCVCAHRGLLYLCTEVFFLNKTSEQRLCCMVIFFRLQQHVPVLLSFSRRLLPDSYAWLWCY